MNFDKYVKKITTFVTIISTYLKNNPINVLIAIGLLISVILIILNITIRKRKYVRDLSYLIRDSMIVVLGYYVLKVIMNDSIKKLLNSIISYHVPILLIIISIFLIECFILNIRSKKSFLVGNSNWIINILLVVLWLYLVTNQSRKFVMNIILYIIGVYNLNIYLKNKKQKSKDINLRSDIPCVKYDDLFKSRKYQLEYILDFISKVNNDEYFSMVLNGDWGTGKTSLLNVLKEKLEEESHFIIYIKPMIVDNRESLMQYFIDNLKVLSLKPLSILGQLLLN